MRSSFYNFLSYFHQVFAFYYRNRLKVLAYHKVPDPIKFEKQIIFLKSKYNIISIKDILNFIDGKSKLPKYPLLITFDDGDISVLQEGASILKKYNIPSCLFIITDLIDSNKEVWIRNVELQEINLGKTYAVAREKVNFYKNMNNDSREEAMENYKIFNTRQLTSVELANLSRSGMYIGNHTHTHPMLDKCSAREIEREFKDALKVFKYLNIPGYNIFAYPNGNTSIKTEMQLKEMGMKLIFLFDHKVNNTNLDPYNISRIRVDSDMTIEELKAKVSGLHPIIHHFKNQWKIFKIKPQL